MYQGPRTDHVPSFSTQVTQAGYCAVAHVWDAGAQKWWRCDDEAVTEMPKGPVAERGDHGVAPEKKVRRHIIVTGKGTTIGITQA